MPHHLSRLAAVTLGALMICLPVAAVTPAWAADDDIRVNEVESSGGAPGDWAELYNAGSDPVDIGGWIVKDDDDTHLGVIAAGTTIAPGGFFVAEEAAVGFGLGSNDAVRLYLADGVTLIDSYSWNGLGHAAVTYGRNPDGSGTFAATTSSTKGAANDFSPPIVINEVESQGGTPGDWIELGNTSESTVDVSGLVLRDEKDSSTLVLPVGTTIESGGYLAVDTEAQFGLGGADSVRLFAADGTTVIDSYTWTTHAATTYGRCTDLTGDLGTTTEPTKGLRNACDSAPIDPAPDATPVTAWPGAATVSTVDLPDTFIGDLSGLAYEAGPAGDTLWAVENGNGTLYRLIFDGTNWVPDAGVWTDGATLRYPDGTGTVDSEGVGFTTAGSVGGMYVASERNNDSSSMSRPSVLRYDVADTTDDLVATREWNLAADLPGLTANGGLEGIVWIPDADLLAAGFADESTGAAYSPASYPGHGAGLFFVGVESDATVYGYALNEDGTFARVATIASGFDKVAELEYDSATATLLVVCDEACDGQVRAFSVGSEGAFEPTLTYARPAGMANIANEGFALAPACINGSRAAFWADDADTDGFSVRVGTYTCTASAVVTPPAVAAGGTAGGQLALTGAESGAESALAVGLGGALLLAGFGAMVAARGARRTRSVL